MKRSPFPPRTTPLVSRTRLQSSPWPRPALSVVVPGGAPVVPPRRRRDTGPSAKVRAAVIERDGGRCIRCGRPAGPGTGVYSIQHRVARGVGGDNSLPNLILLCGTATTLCHGEVESRNPHDLAAGYRLESWQDPVAEPVLVASEGGSGFMAWLTDTGQYSTAPPCGGAA